MVVGLLAGCGNAESGGAAGEEANPAAEEETASAAEPSANPRDILSAWTGVVYDFTAVSGPEELVELSDLAAMGRVTSVGFGRNEVTEVESEDDPTQTEEFTNQLSAVEIQLSEVIKGEAQSGDSIWVELRGDPVVLEKTLPTGLDVVVYAELAVESSPDFAFDLSTSDIPDSEAIWTPAHPEGMTIAYQPDAGTVEPLSGDIEPEGELVESLPRAARN